MSYGRDNAVFQWEDGEGRLREADDLDLGVLETAVRAVLEALRLRLGSSFTIDELVALYASGVDWAEGLGPVQAAGTDSALVVDAAFHRYAREASDYAEILRAAGPPRRR